MKIAFHSNQLGIRGTEASLYDYALGNRAGNGIELEGKISAWWARQNFKVAHGEGLFKHEDLKKYNL